jgi:hypothetical protein
MLFDPNHGKELPLLSADQKMKRSRFKFLGIVLFGIAFMALIWANRTGKFEPRPYQDKATLVAVTDDTRWPEKTMTVTLGAYAQKVYGFDVLAQAFLSEGWVWLVWPQEFQDLLDAGKIPTSDILDVMNLDRTSNFSITPASDSPTKLPDGRYCQVFEYYGKLCTTQLDFRRFPFETLRLPLTFGLNPENLSLNAGNIRLVPDDARSGLGEYTDLPGYVLTGKRLIEFIDQRETSIGPPLGSGKAETRFSRVRMELAYHTSVVAAVLQLFLPLAVVMAVVLLAPNLAGSLWDVRIALPSTALLTLIFLQQGYRTTLPSLPYLTFLDQVYTLCYGASLAIFCLFVWSSNRLDVAPEGERRAVIEYINRVDRRFQVGLTFALIVLVCLSWFFPVR